MSEKLVDKETYAGLIIFCKNEFLRKNANSDKEIYISFAVEYFKNGLHDYSIHDVLYEVDDFNYQLALRLLKNDAMESPAASYVGEMVKKLLKSGNNTDINIGRANNLLAEMLKQKSKPVYESSLYFIYYWAQFNQKVKKSVDYLNQDNKESLKNIYEECVKSGKYSSNILPKKDTILANISNNVISHEGTEQINIQYELESSEKRWTKVGIAGTTISIGAAIAAACITNPVGIGVLASITIIAAIVMLVGFIKSSLKPPTNYRNDNNRGGNSGRVIDELT